MTHGTDGGHMRWLRLDLSWQSSEWLGVLSAESRLTWINLLCYVKGFGSRGRVRSMAPSRFAQMTFVGEESVRQLLIAAESSGALTIEGSEWCIAKWSEYQSDETNAERQARFREKQRQVESNGSNALLTEVTPTNTNTNTSTNTRDNPPTPQGAFKGVEVPPELVPHLEALKEWEQYRKSRKVKTEAATWRKQFAFLKDQPDPEACINQSILQGWSGLFPVKSGLSPRDSMNDKRDRLLRGMA